MLIHGAIVELEQNDVYKFLTDSGGTHGFSGSGLYNHLGEIVGIHTGSFKHWNGETYY